MQLQWWRILLLIFLEDFLNLFFRTIVFRPLIRLFSKRAEKRCKDKASFCNFQIFEELFAIFFEKTLFSPFSTSFEAILKIAALGLFLNCGCKGSDFFETCKSFTQKFLALFGTFFVNHRKSELYTNTPKNTFLYTILYITL